MLQLEIVSENGSMCLVIIFSFQGKLFMFDKVFKPSCTQEDVYNTGAKPIVGGNISPSLSPSLSV